METILTSFSCPTRNNNNIPVDQSKRSSSSHGNNIPRRSAPFRPPIWDFNYIQSITTQYHQGEPYASQVLKLKEKVRLMLNDETTHHLMKLEQVDMIQRLGFSYHFEKEIESIMKGIFNSKDCYEEIWKENLYATALQFRLLRQHQHVISQEVFNNFKDETGDFKASIVNDVSGMLGLYEASFYLQPGEAILEQARDFTSKHLQEFIKNNKNDEQSHLWILVDHALDVPLHWRVPRFEARWFIDNIYSKMSNMNPTFLELAILDFNVVQSVHLHELKESFRLWMDLDIAKTCTFARDRVLENHLWIIGVMSEPQYKSYRIPETVWNALITLVDDIYDTYGTLNELELFTKAFARWDMSAMDPLPNYMKLCFLAIYNETNKLAYDILKQKGLHVIKYLQHWLSNTTTAYFEEAKWYNAKKTPTFHDYLENGCKSIIMPAEIGFAYLFVDDSITEQALEVLQNCSSMIHQSSLISRLINDLSTSSFEIKKGDNPKSIQCYMHETGASEEEARRHMKFLISEAWKLMNKDMADQNSPFSRASRELIFNFTRATFWLYHARDGFGYENNIVTNDCAELIFAKPIPFPAVNIEISNSG